MKRTKAAQKERAIEYERRLTEEMKKGFRDQPWATAAEQKKALVSELMRTRSWIERNPPRGPVRIGTVTGDMIAVPERGGRDWYRLYFNGRLIAEGKRQTIARFSAQLQEEQRGRKYESNPFEHERIADPRTLRRRGLTRVRSKVTPSGDVLRIAFPPGPRRRGSGELRSILHKTNPPEFGYPRSSAEFSGMVNELFHAAMLQTGGDQKRSELMVIAYLRGLFDSELIKKYGKGGTHSAPVRNPRSTMIYSDVISVRGSKANMPHQCDRKCLAAGHRYEHKFKVGSGIYGTTDGSKIVIRRRK